MTSTEANSSFPIVGEHRLSRGRPPPGAYWPRRDRPPATPFRSPLRSRTAAVDPNFSTQTEQPPMPLSPDAEARIMTITGIFMLVFLGTAWFYPWPSCLLMLIFVSYLLQSFGSNRR